MGSFSKLPPIHYLIHHGDVGVNMFFILSGYLVFKSFQHQDPLTFIVMKAIRVFPLMWLIVTSMYFLSITNFANISQISFLDYLHAVTLTFPVNPLDTFLPTLWTLVYQIKFYAGVSVMLLIFLKLKSKKMALLIFIFLYSCVNYFSPNYSFTHNWGLDIYGNFFAIGVLLSILKFSEATNEKFIATMLIVITWLNVFAASRYDKIYMSILLLSCFVVISNFNFVSNRRFLLVLRKLDGITYSVFLIHFPYMLWALRKLSITEINQELIYVLVFISTLLISFCLYQAYDLPVSKRLKKAWENYREKLWSTEK